MNHKLITDRLFYQKVLSIMLPVALQQTINMGVNMGLVGHFYNIIEWVSDEEAERLQREEGMLPGGVTASGSL